MNVGEQPLFLIGYRGTGKSTVARQLAQRLGWDGVDSDDEIERRAGKSIAAIFETDGEPAFRDLESAIVADLCGRYRTVVALGGGAVLREENRAAIQSAGKVVWLTATPETLHRRLEADASTASRRPNLTKSGGLAEIASVLSDREPIYRACATFEVDTEGKPLAAIVDEIIARSK